MSKVSGLPGTGCLVCKDPNAETVGGVCFDCQAIVAVIQEYTGYTEEDAEKLIHGLIARGYIVVDKGFVDMANEMGVPHR